MNRSAEIKYEVFDEMEIFEAIVDENVGRQEMENNRIIMPDSECDLMLPEGAVVRNRVARRYGDKIDYGFARLKKPVKAHAEKRGSINYQNSRAIVIDGKEYYALGQNSLPGSGKDGPVSPEELVDYLNSDVLK